MHVYSKAMGLFLAKLIFNTSKLKCSNSFSFLQVIIVLELKKEATVTTFYAIRSFPECYLHISFSSIEGLLDFALHKCFRYKIYFQPVLLIISESSFSLFLECVGHTTSAINVFISFQQKVILILYFNSFHLQLLIVSKYSCLLFSALLTVWLEKKCVINREV